VKLAENVMHFARILRGAGLPVGPDRVIDALRALQITGVERRDDLYWTLASVFLDRREHFELFDQAFQIFWNPSSGPQGKPSPLPAPPEEADAPGKLLANRLAPALARDSLAAANPETPARPEHDATATASDRERLRKTDFDSMTVDELAAARQLLAHLRLPIPEVPTRRRHPDPRGPHVDLRDTLRASLRGSADLIPLRRRSASRRHPPLVILCDISGSMTRYARMFLHFVHAVTGDRDRVHTFLFGTRLTNVTHHLRHRDVDLALAAVLQAVDDWSGGTRIGTNLAEFNLRWSRRVLGQNAVVLLISDGLDRDPGTDLGQAMDRLHRSCRRLIWLNPLLRFDGFEPLARGIRAMLPHVDAFVPAHNIASLADLARVLSAVPPHPGRLHPPPRRLPA
jgi:hypothetical protein